MIVVACTLRTLEAREVELIRRAAPENFNVIRRIAACRHRPPYILHIGRIDVIVDNNCEAPQIGGSMTLRGNGSRLTRVTGVPLPNGNDGKKAGIAFGRAVDSYN